MPKTLILFMILAEFVAESTSTESVYLTPLKGVNRLGLDFRDYYFSCNAVGRILQWQYNNQLLTGFHSTRDEIGRSVVVERPTFTHTTTLLSSEPAENNYRDMNSILIVSFSNGAHSPFTVTCSNGPNTQTVSAEPISQVEDSSMRNNNSDSRIVLEYIVSTNMLRNSPTHIFMCGTNHSQQLLQVDGPPPIGFMSSDEIGFHRVASATAYTVKEQGIFIARSPYMMTTVLIVANEEDVSVSCFYGDVSERLESTYNRIPTASVKASTRTQSIHTTEMLTTDRATTFVPGSTSSETMDLVPMFPNAGATSISVPTIAGTVVAVAFLITIVVGVVVSFIFHAIKKRKFKYPVRCPMEYPSAETCRSQEVNTEMDIAKKCKYAVETCCSAEVKTEIPEVNTEIPEVNTEIPEVNTEIPEVNTETEVTADIRGTVSNRNSCSTSGIWTSNSDSSASINNGSSTTEDNLTCSEVQTTSGSEKESDTTSEEYNSATSEENSTTNSVLNSSVQNDVQNDMDYTNDPHRRQGLWKRLQWTKMQSCENIDKEECTRFVENKKRGNELAPEKDTVEYDTPKLNSAVFRSMRMVGPFNYAIKALKFQLNEYVTNRLPQYPTAKVDFQHGTATDVRPTEQQVQERGSQFAAVTTGTLQKPVYVRRDGETFENPIMRDTPKLNKYVVAVRGVSNWLMRSFNYTIKTLEFQLNEYVTNRLPQYPTAKMDLQRGTATDIISTRPINAEEIDGSTCILTPRQVINNESSLSYRTIRCRT